MDRVKRLSAHLTSSAAASATPTATATVTSKPVPLPSVHVPGAQYPLPNHVPEDVLAWSQGQTYDNVLGGNWRPVSGEDLHVEGLRPVPGYPHIPDDLDGQYVRTGPNPMFDFRGLPYHPFDGDGCVHGVTFKRGGVASYTRRMVVTRSAQVSVERGFDVPWFGSMMAGQFDVVGYTLDEARDGQRMGRANTGAVVYNKKLLIMEEGDFPYHVLATRNGKTNLRTVGRVFNDKLHFPVTAHPKVCPRTGEIILFGYNLQSPFIRTAVLSAAGEVTSSFKFSIPLGAMIHDCAITSRHTLIMDYNLNFDLSRIEQNRPPLAHDEERQVYFYVFPRHATSESEVRKFPVDGGMAMHFVNAWEHGDEISVVACRTNGQVKFTEKKRPPEWYHGKLCVGSAVPLATYFSVSLTQERHHALRNSHLHMQMDVQIQPPHGRGARAASFSGGAGRRLSYRQLVPCGLLYAVPVRGQVLLEH